MTKRFLSILLVFVMVFSMLSLNVFATKLEQNEQIDEIEQSEGEIKDLIERYLVPCDNEEVSETYLYEFLHNDNGTDKNLTADEVAKLEAHLDVCSFCFDAQKEKGADAADNKADGTIKDSLIDDEPAALTAMPLSSNNEFLLPISPRDPNAIAISTAEELREIVNGGSYYLTNDIDLSSYDFWTPLNVTELTSSITLDGQGHRILNMNVYEINYGGLFGNLSAVDLTIKNLGLENPIPDRKIVYTSNFGIAGSFVANMNNSNLRIENCYNAIAVSGTINGHTGGIVGKLTSNSTGENTCIIENCYNLGSLGSINTHIVGGIVASIENSMDVRITNCFNKGSIMYSPYYAGGILGYTHNSGAVKLIQIENCYNESNIGGRYAAGILSNSNFNTMVEIKNCYNTGNIRAYASVSPSNAAGIMSPGIRTTSISIENCYNTGTVTSVGGWYDAICYSETEATIKNCYYLDTSVVTSTYGIPKTDAEMKSQQTFQGFNFENVWAIGSGVNSGYPTLRTDALTSAAYEKLFSIAGTITNKGTPLLDIGVILKDKDGKPVYSTKSDENGAYSFKGIAKSDSPYSVVIDSPTYDADDVVITAPDGVGVTITVDIEVLIREIITSKYEEDYTLKGTVRSTANNINGLKLTINPTGETVSEKNGVYSHTLRGGTGYTLIASAPGYITQKVGIVFPQDSKELVLDILLQADTQTANNNFSVNNPHVWLDETLGANPSFLVNVGNGGSSHIIIQSPSSLVGTDVTIKVGEFPATGLRFDEIDRNTNKVTKKELFDDGTIKSAEYSFTTENGTDKINAFSITVIDPKIPRYEIPVYAIYNDKQGVSHTETIGWIIINIPMSVNSGGQITLTGPSTHKTGEGITVTGKVAGDKSAITIYRVLSNGTEVEINKEATTPLGVSLYSANIVDLPYGINKLVARTEGGTVSNYHYIFVKMELQVVVEKLSERTNIPGKLPREYLQPNLRYGVITATESFNMYEKPFFNLTLYFNVENKGEYVPVVSFAGKTWDTVLLRETSLNDSTVHYYKCDIDNWYTRNVSEMYIDLLDKDNDNDKIETLAAIINAQHDPSGYVYDIDAPDERIAGATATLQKLVDGEWEVWVAQDGMQENPQQTDGEGKYSWYVEEGTYRVLISKDKYTNVIDKSGVAIANMPDGSFNSEIPDDSQIIVLPPHFDVNVPLKRTEYTVSVDGGTGGGSKTWGREVSVTAGTAPKGQRFKHFTATGLSRATYATNPLTFTMPDNAVSITTVYENIPSGGKVDSTNSSKDEVEDEKVQESAIDKKPEQDKKPEPEKKTVENISVVDLTSLVAKYTDIPKNAWYYNPISLVIRKGLFKGTSENTFEPNALMTRAMFVTVLANLEGVELSAYNKAPFSDVKASAWYANQVAWASGLGIVSGVGGNNFAPNKPITREEMAVMLNNYLKVKNITLPKNGSAVAFADISTVSDWAQEAIIDMRRAGIIDGIGDNKYAPKVTATRAYVAQIFANYLNIMDK